MSELIKSLQNCTEILDDLMLSHQEALAAVTEGGKQIEKIESMINQKAIPKIPFEKTMHTNGKEIYILSIHAIPNNEKHFRIFGEIINTENTQKNVRGALRQLKLAPRIKLMKYLEPFLESYRDYSINYLTKIKSE